jgi:ADP-L-glycero-D-manno-heptose 6-epimerase
MIDAGQILVTGGAGFIGSALVWALNQRGITNIVIADYLGTDEKWKNLVPLKFVHYIEADELLQQLGTRRLADIRTIFHLGANSSTTERDCRLLIQNNYEFSRRLAECALNCKARFVYASSAATYGDGSQGMEDEVDQLERLRPLNMYGYSKHLFDVHAQRQGWLDRLVGLKYFNVFGPNENHKNDMRSVVNKAYHQICATGRVQLFKSCRPDYRDGEQMRDFLYVKDAVDMTIHLAETPTATGLFNIGSGKSRTWIDLVKPIFVALNLPISIEFIDMPEELRNRYQYHTCADISNLQSTGWRGPVQPLEAAVDDYVRNYLQPDRHLGDEPLRVSKPLSAAS